MESNTPVSPFEIEDTNSDTQPDGRLTVSIVSRDSARKKLLKNNGKEDLENGLARGKLQSVSCLALIFLLCSKFRNLF